MSIWKPADRTESLHIMLNLRPDEGITGRGRPDNTQQEQQQPTRGEKKRDTVKEEQEVERERETGVSVTGGGKQSQDAFTGKHTDWYYKHKKS